MNNVISKNRSDTKAGLMNTTRFHYQRQTPNEQNDAALTARLCADLVAVEEPLQIILSWYEVQQSRYQQQVLTITMRTPGDDQALVYGFLLSEGIISAKEDVLSCCFDDQGPQDNISYPDNKLTVTLAKHIQPDWQVIKRQFVNHSSCGLCGKTSLNALQLKKTASPQPASSTQSWLTAETICRLPELLKSHQEQYQQSGGVHAAGYFCDSQLLSVCEDIGRHNAVDKVIGDTCLYDLIQPRGVLVLSGRISFELVQKAVMANIDVIAAVGAPSSLALAAAKQFGLTLIGFIKKDSLNVYHGHWRVKK